MKAGWEVKTIDEIAEVKGGKRLPKGFLLQSEKTEHPYITVSDFTDDGTIDLSKIRFISKDIFEQIKRYTISAKDIYISIAGTIGKTGRVPPELDGANLTENACKLVLKQNIERDFIYYFTKSQDFSIQAGLNTRTAAQPKLALERLKTISLAIPTSLEEQQRIVAILDQAFNGIAKARANAEQNLLNARALFESHLQSVFTQRGEGWTEKRFDQVCVLQRGFDLPTQSRTQGKYPLVTSNGVTDTHNEAKVKGPGVVTGRSGSIGNVFFVEDDFWPLNTALYIKDFHDNDPKFIHIFLQYFDLKRFATGTGVPTLNRNFVHSETVTTPDSVSEQKSIVRKVQSLLKETQRLEALYQRKIECLDELKKTLLQQAFAGRL